MPIDRRLGEEITVSFFKNLRADYGMHMMALVTEAQGLELIKKGAKLVGEIFSFVDNINSLNVESFNLLFHLYESSGKVFTSRREFSIQDAAELEALFRVYEETIVQLKQLQERSATDADTVEGNGSLKNEGLNPLLYLVNNFDRKADSDLNRRFEVIQQKLERQGEMAGVYSQRARDILRLVAGVGRQLENLDLDQKENEERALGLIVLLEKMLGITPDVQRTTGLNRGAAEDLLASLNQQGEQERALFMQRWETIVQHLQHEAQQAQGEEYSNDRRAMMKQVIELFGSWNPDLADAGARLDLLESILHIQQSNPRMSGTARDGGSRSIT